MVLCIEMILKLLHQDDLQIAASRWSSNCCIDVIISAGLINLLLHQDGLQIAASG